MSCSLMAEAQDILLREGSLIHKMFRSTLIAEKYNCGFSLDRAYKGLFEQSNLKCVGYNQEGDVRVVEMRNKQCFLAMLFHPHLS